MTPLLTHAIKLAEQGTPVFPCGRSKKPCIPKKEGGRGFLDATTDQAVVERMFRHHGAAMIGTPTGTVSGFDVLDIDPRHGGELFEQANLERLPETRIHQTPGGGRHYFFLHVPGIFNSASSVAPGVDVRGEGGYVIIPPSHGYQIVSDASACHWPDWLLTLILPQTKPPTPRAPGDFKPLSSARIDGIVRHALGKIRAAPEGQKHFILRNYSKYLGGIQHWAGFSTADAIARIMDALPETVIDHRNALATAKWAFERGVAAPIAPPDDRPEFTRASAGPQTPPPNDIPHADHTLPQQEQPSQPERPPAVNVVDIAEARTKERLFTTLIRSDEGKILAVLANAMAIFAMDPKLKGLLTYNSFTHRPQINRVVLPSDGSSAALPGPYPRAWAAPDVAMITSYIQRNFTARVSAETVEAAMVAEAALKAFHPVVDWLAKLKWDGLTRLDTWLSKAFGAHNDAYHNSVGAKFLIAAVKRVRHPGCKFDHMPVVEGEQGIGKSTALRRLFSDDWFSDAMPKDLESKDSLMQMQGVWCIEFAEIEQIIRAEVETIKAFLSRSVDRFRSPYGKQVGDFPRQGVVIGTTNSSDYLRDASGNRRFWPVKAAFVDLQWIDANREQLWAEAAAREAAGEAHWIDDAEVQATATQHQAERMQEDSWTDMIRGFLQGALETTITAVLNHMQIPMERRTRREEMRVSKILRQEGWACKVVGRATTSRRVYFREPTS